MSERSDLPPTTGVFAGHLGHLTPSQDKAFSTFKINLTNAHLYTGPASHDDPTLLCVSCLLKLRFRDAQNAIKAFPARAALRCQRSPETIRRCPGLAQTTRGGQSVRNLRPCRDRGLQALLPAMDWPAGQGRCGLAPSSRCLLASDTLQNGLPLYVYHLASLGPLEKKLHAVSSKRRYQRM